MHRLRHPIRHLREPFGTAGLLVACLALVFALAGGAYAASGALSGKQKKEVEKIAKKFAGKPGANGTNGSNGAAGAKGDTGTGAEGKQGPEGKAGKEGKEGSPWTAGGKLPSGRTETGTWAASQESLEYGAPAAISFSVPLAAALGEENVHFEGQPEFEESCPGTAETPEAAKGNLCVYAGTARNVELERIVTPSSPGNEDGAGTSGAIIRLAPLGTEPSPAIAWGTWAVTAP